MVEIDVFYEGELHTRCVHGPSGAETATDAPRDNEGKGECFSPTDLAATALGSCMLTVMGITARRHDWPLEGSRARVEKHMTSDLPRRIERLVLQMQMAPGLPPQAHDVLERAARSCPVALSLHPDIEVDLAFDWGSAG